MKVARAADYLNTLDWFCPFPGGETPTLYVRPEARRYLLTGSQNPGWGKHPMASPGLFCDVEVMEDLGILPARATTSAPLPCQSNPPHHILVAEDDIFFRQLNTEVLLQSGYAVDSAEDGAAAWDALNADRYDLLITDHNMPKVSGVELLQKLQAAHMPLPVIMVTATVPQEEFTRDPSLQPAANRLQP